MAEHLVSVAKKLIKDVFSNQGNTADGRRTSPRNKRMEELRNEIEEFHNFLEDKENRKDNDQNFISYEDVLEVAEKLHMIEEVKDWLVKVKDVYYQVIDVCQELRNERKVERNSGNQPLSCSFPTAQDCKIQIRDKILQMIEEILEKIQEVKVEKIKEVEDKKIQEVKVEKIKEVKDKKIQEVKDEKVMGVMKQIHDSMLGTISNSRIFKDQSPETFEHDEEKIKNFHSREKEIDKLKSQVYHCCKEVKVVCILGETGIGKSGLAQKVYGEVMKDFELRAFVNVSAEFNHLRIAREFVESVTSKKLTKTEWESLTQKVDEIIKEKKYLLVLDGLREDEKDSKSEWDKLISIFKSGGTGCTILMTTNQVNDLIIKTSPYIVKLKKLPDDVCWSIIVDQAFGVSQSTPQTKITIDGLFNSVDKKLAGKCEGLPVIAKALGGVLRDRTSEDDWEKVLTSDLWELAPKDKPAMKATMLTYHFLPPDLKQCLLYCSIFPKNQTIDVDQLISLWMAQDCIWFDRENDNMEAEGWRRFEKLLKLSIFQYYTPEGDSGVSGVFQCKLQGAMSDFVRELADQECHTMPPAYKGESKLRHCMVNVLVQDSLPKTIPNSENLHTLKVLSEYSSIDPSNLSNILSKMRWLRALVLSYCSMRKLPQKACELLHLRYLNLSFNRDLKKLPEEICNLYNLQSLNLNGCDELQELPKNIGKLTKLRHLDILWTPNLSFLPKGLTSLVSLKRLSRFFGATNASTTNKACNLSDMKHLKKLQGYIAIEGLGVGKNPSTEANNAELNQKKAIVGLELWFSVVGSEESNNYHQDVLVALKPPEKLECLGIFNYRGQSFSPWILEMMNLKHLLLSDCDNCDTLPGLGTLQTLETLEVKNLSNVKEVNQIFLGSVEKTAFPKLKKLCFRKLDNWENWVSPTDGKTHMPELSYLLIERCLKLKKVPNYIESKKNLKLDGKLGKPKIVWTKLDADKDKSGGPDAKVP